MDADATGGCAAVCEKRMPLTTLPRRNPANPPRRLIQHSHASSVTYLIPRAPHHPYRAPHICSSAHTEYASALDPHPKHDPHLSESVCRSWRFRRMPLHIGGARAEAARAPGATERTLATERTVRGELVLGKGTAAAARAAAAVVAAAAAAVVTAAAAA